MKFNKILIAFNPQLIKSAEISEKLKKTLISKGAKEVYISPLPEFKKNVDLVITVGGDGTFLATARFYAEHDVPVLGINAGRLGFLAQVQLHEIEQSIEKLFNGDYEIQERLMLQAQQGYTALNDIVIKSNSMARAQRFYLYINGKHVCDYLADGVIVSTPTGSTAYNLSAGGPVMVPEIEALVISPICPHALTSRPIVIPAYEVISIETSEPIYLTADGQLNELLNEKITILRNTKNAKVVMIERDKEGSCEGFYSVVREKLHWGVGP